MNVRGLPLPTPVPAVRRAGLACASLVLLAGALSGCLGASSDGLKVVSTVPPVTDLVEEIVGDRATVTGLIPAGEDAHTFQPRPSEARALAEADVFFDNGLGLNDLIEMAANDQLPETATRVELGAVAVPETEYVRNPGLCHFDHCHASLWNPHLWTDPVHARAYVEEIGRVMAEVDPAGAEQYEARVTELVGAIDTLDEAIREAVATIPDEDRKLVVYHDAWDYFAKRYGFETIGVIQPVDFSEPSAQEVREMIEQIRSEDVPAFFGSEVFPTDVLEVVAEETDAEYVPDLADDRIPGQPGEPDHSYVEMMRQNARLIVTALGGDPSALDSTAPAPGG